MNTPGFQHKPTEPPLLRTETNVATLAMECYVQVQSLALLAGASPERAELTNENWYYLLSPIVERLDQLSTLINNDLVTGEVRLYPVA